MSEEITVGNAEPTTETTAVQSNISVSEFAQRRLGQLTPKEEVAPQVEATEEVADEVPVTESNEETVEETEVAEQTEDPQGSTDVLSQLDLDEMSEDELKELSEKLGSRAVARYGELTAKRKAAERKLEEIQAELNKSNPLETQTVAENPYASIDSLEGLQDKAKEVTDVIEWAEETLFNADGYGPNDVVTEIEGKSLTKADVRKSLLNARKARDKFLPAQLREVQRVEQAKQLKSAFDTQAQNELKWLQGEDNDVRKNYEAMVGDPRFEKLIQNADPEVSAQLNYLMAHAANSIYGRKTIQETPKNAKLNPPQAGITSASMSEKTVGKSVKALKDLNQRFKQSGTKGDFITLRTQQIKNKF